MDEEEIFQINDYTKATDFEELTSAIELYLRQAGLSVDVRQGETKTQSQKFTFNNHEFTCHYISNKEEKTRTQDGADLPCLADMSTDSPTFYPFSGHPLTQFFGLTDFIVIRGKVPHNEEKTILSAFAVGAQSAKCALPLFITRHEERETASLLIQGVLSFPGYYANFEVWNLGTQWESEQKLSFVGGFCTLLDFFSTRLGGYSKGVKGCAYSAYSYKKSIGSRSPSNFDVLCELHVYCKWSSRPAEQLISCLYANEFLPRLCEYFRVEIIEQIPEHPISDFVMQLERQIDAMERVNKAKTPVISNLAEAVYFDEYVLMLDEVFQMFPINSLWTKLAIDLLDDGLFSPSMVKTFIENIRRVAESGKTPIDTSSDFKLFSKSSTLHQHSLIIFAGLQCSRLLQDGGSLTDINSRCVFMHLSPSRALEQQLIDPEALVMYKKELVNRVLKAFLVDKFTEKGRVVDVTEFIAWHKESLNDFPYYNFLCSGLDDGEMMTIWQKIASKSFTDIHSCIKNELIKEVEMSIQALEEIHIDEVAVFLPGLCISAVLSKLFRQQTAFLNSCESDPFVIPSIKELIRPAFRVFLKDCRNLPRLQDMDSVIIEALKTILLKLELSISKAFSLSIKFPESKGLTRKLMDMRVIDVVDGAERGELLAYISNFQGKTRKTNTVLYTDKARLTCVIEGKSAHLAIARIDRERPI